MANIHVALSEYSIGVLDTASTLLDDTVPGDGLGSPIKAIHQNGPASAVVQIETALGLATTLKGNMADLVARLAVELDANGKLKDAAGLVLTAGSVLFGGASNLLGQDNANLFWDDATNQLSVGTNLATAGKQLDVVGIILSRENLEFKSGTAFIGTLDHTITAARTWTLPDLTDTVVLLTATQTLTTKTINSASNTLTLNLATGTLVGTTAQFNTALSDNDFATLAGSETLTNKTINLASNTLTGTTAQFNTALSDNEFATLAGIETLSNKTINLASNTLTGTLAQFNIALSDHDFATLAGSETLTNKTINLTSNTLVGTTAQFNTALSDNDFATLAGLETLSSKTFDLSVNALTGTTAQFNTALSDNNFATLAGSETLTSKTITAPVLSGTITGTYTLGGTPTISGAIISGDAPASPAANVLYTDSLIKGWAKWSLSGGTVTLDDDVNVSSITDNAVGDFTVNWVTAFSSAHYVIFGSVCELNNADNNTPHFLSLKNTNAANPTTTAVRVITVNNAATLVDPIYASLAAIGNN